MGDEVFSDILYWLLLKQIYLMQSIELDQKQLHQELTHSIMLKVMRTPEKFQPVRRGMVKNGHEDEGLVALNKDYI